MKVYIAGPWAERDAVRVFAGKVVEAGHDITEAWWYHPESTDHTELVRQGFRDWDAVQEADAMIVINSKKSEGKAVEMGLALAYGLAPIIVVGPRTNIFHHLPNIFMVATGEEAIERLVRH